MATVKNGFLMVLEISNHRSRARGVMCDFEFRACDLDARESGSLIWVALLAQYNANTILISVACWVMMGRDQDGVADVHFPYHLLFHCSLADVHSLRDEDWRARSGGERRDRTGGRVVRLFFLFIVRESVVGL